MQKLRKSFHLTREIFFTSRPHCGNGSSVGLFIVVLAVVALAVFERQIGGTGG
jgi:hypothetical protein